ncbi:MAG: TetR/AcrR family transcriptional regulator [Deltaproteobacteria bacterium]|nr:TetR/AcrR family transcriptional regulator [Deltaproteobacteria bacterium]
MKARILAAARQAFGELGFHGATTRHIAGLVGVDISTLHYHWGDKGDLFEAAVLDITEDLRQKLVEVERMIHGKPLAERLDIAIDQMTDYLFAHPEVSNLTLRRYFGQTRHEMTWDNHLPVFVNDIARSMGLAPMRGQVEKRAKMQVFAIMLAIYNFVSGGEFISHSLGLEREEYIPLVKQTLRFMLIPPFLSQTCPTQREQETPPNLT